MITPNTRPVVIDAIPEYVAPEVAANGTDWGNGVAHEPPAAPAPVAGSAAGPATGGGPRAPRHEAWIDVPGYEGFRALVWLNFPQRLLRDLQSGDQEQAAAAFRRVVIEHNGWCDEGGEPYPAADDPAFWDTIPLHLAVNLIRAINETVTAAPLAAPRNTRSGSH